MSVDHRVRLQRPHRRPHGPADREVEPVRRLPGLHAGPDRRRRHLRRSRALLRRVRRQHALPRAVAGLPGDGRRHVLRPGPRGGARVPGAGRHRRARRPAGRDPRDDRLQRPIFDLPVLLYIALGALALASTVTVVQRVLKQGLAVSVAGKRVLVVDDIADSGKSLQLALNYLQGQGAAEIKSATLYYKRKSVIQPSFFEKVTECWVVFPWETRETLREILNSHKGKRDVNHAVAKLVKSGLPQHLADTLLASMQEQP